MQDYKYIREKMMSLIEEDGHSIYAYITRDVLEQLHASSNIFVYFEDWVGDDEQWFDAMFNAIADVIRKGMGE